VLFFDVKGETSFLDDNVVEGGRQKVRNFQRSEHMLRFYGVTRCYDSHMRTVIADLSEAPYPAVIVANSAVSDITRSVLLLC